MKHPDDGKYVLVQGGQRISDLMPSEQKAIEEALKRRKLAESTGLPADNKPPIEVKQNLYG